jgi:hypothetical protein
MRTSLIPAARKIDAAASAPVTPLVAATWLYSLKALRTRYCAQIERMKTAMSPMMIRAVMWKTLQATDVGTSDTGLRSKIVMNGIWKFFRGKRAKLALKTNSL